MNHRLGLATLILAGACALGGCKTKPNPDAEGLDCESEVCPVTIAISAPDPMTYTNGDLPIQVTVTPSNHGPMEIQLLKDGALLAPLAPPFSYTWKTTQEREATYEIRAAASIAGKTVRSEPITVVVDRTAPTIVSGKTTPAPGASNVSLSDPIQIVFSESVDPTTAPSSAIALKDSSGASLGASATLSSDGTTLTVSAWNRGDLGLPGTVTESLAATIADRAGNFLVAPAPWSWTAPLWVKLPSLLGRAPSLALDSEGQPTIAFIKPDPANPSSSTGPLGIARYALGSTWDLSLQSPTNTFVGSTALSVDPSRAPVAAWPEMDHVRVARLTAAGWQDVGGNADAGLPSAQMGVSSLALNAAGDPLVGIWAFVQQMSAPSGYVASWSGSVWQLLTASNMPFATSTGGPLIAVDSTGAPTVWSNGTLQRFVAGNWLTVDPSLPSGGTYPTLALDLQDRPVLAFQTSSGGMAVLDVRAFTANTWQAFSPSVSSAPGGFAEVRVAMRSDGHPTIAWRELGGGVPDLRVARHTAGGWVADLGTINAVSGGTPGRVQMALDRLGAPVIAFDEYDSNTTTTSVYVWRSNR